MARGSPSPAESNRLAFTVRVDGSDEQQLTTGDGFDIPWRPMARLCSAVCFLTRRTPTSHSSHAQRLHRFFSGRCPAHQRHSRPGSDSGRHPLAAVRHSCIDCDTVAVEQYTRTATAMSGGGPANDPVTRLRIRYRPRRATGNDVRVCSRTARRTERAA
jgi:hypothetical protein